MTVATRAGTGEELAWVARPRTFARELFDPAEPRPRSGAAAVATAMVGQRNPADRSRVVAGIWALGAALSLLRLVHGLAHTAGIRRRAIPWGQMYPGPHPLAGLDRTGFPLMISDELVGAVVVGAYRPVILVGRALADGPTSSLRQVLLHETAHARRRDPLWGLAERLVQAVYWFHPAVWLLRAAIAQAREEACDDPVLAAFPAADYARTLLALAAYAGASGDGAPRVGAASARTGIQRRIHRLLHGPALPHVRATGRLVLAGTVLVLLGGWLTAVLMPAARAAQVTTALPSGASDPLDPAFAPAVVPAGPPAQGAFVLHDLARGSTIVVNDRLARQRLTPASTFKVVIALAGLATGVIPDAHTRLTWNGQNQGVAAWNQDHDLASAMRTSATWYFQDVLNRLDRAQLRGLLDQLQYGNRDTAGDWRSFWIEGGLRISALEQAQVMTRLLAGPAGIDDRSRALLDQVTELGRHGQAVLHGKTGTAESGGQTVAWLVGYVRGPRRFAYATLMVAPGQDSTRLRNTRRQITESLLVRYGALPAGAEAGR